MLFSGTEPALLKPTCLSEFLAAKTRSAADMHKAAQTLQSISSSLVKSWQPDGKNAFPEEPPGMESRIHQAKIALDLMQDALHRFRSVVYSPDAKPKRKPKNPISTVRAIPVTKERPKPKSKLDGDGRPEPGAITFRITGKHRQPIAHTYYSTNPKTAVQKRNCEQFMHGFKREAEKLKIGQSFDPEGRFMYFIEDYQKIRRQQPALSAAYCYGIACARLEQTFEQLESKKGGR